MKIKEKKWHGGNTGKISAKKYIFGVNIIGQDTIMVPLLKIVITAEAAADLDVILQSGLMAMCQHAAGILTGSWWWEI